MATDYLDATEALKCKHCGDIIPSLDAISDHECFIDKEVYMDKNILFAEKLESSSIKSLSAINTESNAGGEKSSFALSKLYGTMESQNKLNAIWNQQSTLALLNLYEANLHLADNAKKKTKIWTAISEGLRDFAIEMNSDQVRWKINSLLKRYKECADNNAKSGQAPKTFEYYDQLEEIIGQERSARALYTVSSKIPFKIGSTTEDANVKSQTRGGKRKNDDEVEPSTSASIENRYSKTYRPRHGSGSKIAQEKLELQTQWLKYTENINKREEEQMKEYKKHLEVQKQRLELRKNIAEKQMKSKERRHKEIIEIEGLKINLLKKLIHNKENIKEINDSD